MPFIIDKPLCPDRLLLQQHAVSTFISIGFATHDQSFPEFSARSFILCKCIRCHRNDRNASLLLIRKPPDRPRCLVAVHDRHLDIHQNQIIIIFPALLQHLQQATPSFARSTKKLPAGQSSMEISAFRSSSARRIRQPDRAWQLFHRMRL